MTAALYALCAYLTALSLLAVFLTIHDKRRARQHGRRIPERTLMLVGLAGGALAMYLTMRAIRHKNAAPEIHVGGSLRKSPSKPY